MPALAAGAARAAYSLLTVAAQPLLRRKLRRRGATEPGYLEAIDERFGRYAAAADEAIAPGVPAGAAASDGPRVWLHAVSLGETRAAAILVAALRERLPDLRLLLTHGTATGRAEGARLLRPGDLQAWQPWDTPEAVGRFLDAFRPAAGLLMETEVWPNLVDGCARRGIPLALVNARLNERSLRGARRLGWLSRPAYGALSLALPQSAADAARLRSLGAPVAAPTGNLKFDAAPDPARLAAGARWRSALDRPVVLLASAREGEEAMLADRLVALRRPGGAPGAVRWMVVPRHPQRFDEAEALLRARGLSVARRSAWADDGPAADAQARAADVWLGDSLGEMALYYRLAAVALLGGSFAGFGGQNLIEAAACGCPVVMGASTFNFAEASAQAEQAGAALRVDGMAAGVAAAVALATDGARHAAAVRAAQAFSAAHRGAAVRTVEALLPLLERAGAARRA
ncbi:MAG: 3-deoxy-D-manno-octulosonic acid transferase [Xylophilus ampelinus]